MNINAVNSTQPNWTTTNQWATTNDKEPVANTEIQKLTKDIEKEESELVRINKEFSEHLSKGEQDMAQMKSAELTLKQMQIQAMRSKIDKLEKPEQSSSMADPVTSDTAGTDRPKFDQFVKSGDKPAETAGIYHLETDDSGNQKIVFDGPEARGDNLLTAVNNELSVADLKLAANEYRFPRGVRHGGAGLP